LFAEKGEGAGWIKNIRPIPTACVRIEDLQINATAQVLDRRADRELWDQVAAIADRKYGWGGGLPEIMNKPNTPEKIESKRPKRRPSKFSTCSAVPRVQSPSVSKPGTCTWFWYPGERTNPFLFA
jgi:hypothetical protein